MSEWAVVVLRVSAVTNRDKVYEELGQESFHLKLLASSLRTRQCLKLLEAGISPFIIVSFLS